MHSHESVQLFSKITAHYVVSFWQAYYQGEPHPGIRVHGRVITLRNVPTKGVKFEAKCFEYITWRLDVLRIRKYIHVVGIFKNLF